MSRLNQKYAIRHALALEESVKELTILFETFLDAGGGKVELPSDRAAIARAKERLAEFEQAKDAGLA